MASAATEWVLRALLEEEHHDGDEHDGHDDDHHGHEDGHSDDTFDIRIIAIFVILLAGIIGGLVPLYVKVRWAPPIIFFSGRVAFCTRSLWL